MTDSWQEVPPPSTSPSRPGRSRARRIAKVVSGVALVLLIAAVAIGISYHPGWVETVPGEAQPIAAHVHVDGARSFPPRSSVNLVYVRERDNLNYWEYLFAKYVHDHAELSPEPPPSPITPDQMAACDMRDSQATAKAVALRRLGYNMTTLPGMQVVAIYRLDAPVAKVLQCGDVIEAIDGTPTPNHDRLTHAIGSHHIGDSVLVRYVRDGKVRSDPVRLVGDEGVPRLGIEATEPVRYPVKLTIDTGNIGGPSAGLAMTLTLLDTLTPGELTGGKRVVATGTIEPDGSVGEIGAVELKAVAVSQSRADLFLIPKCQEDPKRDPAGLADCRSTNDQARRNAKGVKVVEVGSLDDALAALRAAGGAPLVVPPTHS